MDVMRFRARMGRALLLVALLSMPMHVYALGFGAIVLESHLNQKLQAHIPMLLNTSDDINTIRVELASADEYKQLGLQWQAELALIRVSLHGKHSEQPLVQLSSAEWIHVPMLSILLKAKKSGRGTYFKHYQLLLDAAEVLALRPQLAPLNAVATNMEASVASSDIAALPHAGDWARIWRYGPVQRGDSLSEIAYRLRVDKRFSNRQVMLSLYENNRDAFGGGDINRLIKGVWLNVPSAAVVEQSSGQAAMQKLTQLLTRQKQVEKKRVGIEPVKLESVKREALQGSKQQRKSAKLDATANASSAPSLRFSGKISMQGLDDGKTVTALRQGFDQQFASIHQRMMAGKLQMAKLDDTVSSLNVSMQVVKQDIQVMKRDIAIIKTHTAGSSNASWMSWQVLLIAALMLIIIVLLVMVLRKEKRDDEADVLSASDDPSKAQLVESEQDEYEQIEDEQIESERVENNRIKAERTENLPDDDQNAVPESHPVHHNDRVHDQNREIEFIPELQSPSPMAKENSNLSKTPELRLSHASAPLAEAVIQLLNQIEESLGQCEFEQAEGLLQQVDEQWPDSLRASALKAQLYYETDRQAEMHDLINNISSTSDEQRWEQFCYFLPSHVWNACFGDGASAAFPPRSDQA